MAIFIKQNPTTKDNDNDFYDDTYDSRYSEVCEQIARDYVDKLSSFFLLCLIARKSKEEFNFDDLYIEELNGYVNYYETLQLWENVKLSELQDIYIEAIFSYLYDATEKLPINDYEYFKERWTNNVKTGIKSLGLRNKRK